MSKRLVLIISLARSGPSNFFVFPFDGAQGTTNASGSLYGCPGLCMVADRDVRENVRQSGAGISMSTIRFKSLEMNPFLTNLSALTPQARHRKIADIWCSVLRCSNWTSNPLCYAKGVYVQDTCSQPRLAMRC